MIELTVDQMIDDIIRREAGYVNHPKDRGGPTKYGITLATLREWCGDQALNEDDVREMSRDLAHDIYEARYYREPKIDQLPPALQPFLFDCAVNHGTSRAVKFLQRACEAKEDGRIGPATLAQVDKYTPEGLLRALIDIRRNFYLNIVRADPGQKAFLPGWLNRLAEFENDLANAQQEMIASLRQQLTAAEARIAELEATAAAAAGDRVAHPSLDTSVVPGSAQA